MAIEYKQVDNNDNVCLNLDGKYTCRDWFNCCDCGQPDSNFQCCMYCFSCNACENCLKDD